MDELHQRNNYNRRDRDNFPGDIRYNHPRRDYQQDRGRSYNYRPPRRNYYDHNRVFDRDRNPRRWVNIRPKPASPVRSRPASPVEGSEEFLTRKIQNTSALIMRHLLAPEEALPSNKKPVVKEAKSKGSITKVDLTSSCKRQAKPAPKGVTYTAEEIRQKIVEHVTKLNEGRRKNFINMKNSSELDNALNLINKRKRLELSEILRRMNSTATSGDGNVPVVVDIGVEFQDLPRDIIEELRKTLGIDLDQFEQDHSEPVHPASEREFPALISTTSHKTHESTSEQLTQPPTFEKQLTATAFDTASYIQSELNLHRTSEYESSTTAHYIQHDSTLLETASTPVPEIKSEPSDPTFGDIQLEPHYNKANGPICDSSQQIETESQQIEVKEEPSKEPKEEPASVDDVFVEPFHTPAAKDEPGGDKDYSDSEPVTSYIESSQKFTAVMAIEATIKTFIEIDKKESGPHYASYNDLIDKIKGFERCSKLLEEYKNELMEDLFGNVRKLDEEDPSYYSPDNSQERPSDDVVVSKTSEGTVGSRKRTCEEESGEEAKKMKIVVKDDDLGSRLNIEERVCALMCTQLVSADNEMLFIGTESGKVLMVHPNKKSNEILKTLEVGDGPVSSLAFYGPNNKFLYVGTATKLLQFYGRKRGEFITSVNIPSAALCMAISWGWIFVGCKNGIIVRYKHTDRCIDMEDTSESRLDVLAMKAICEGPRKILIVGQRRGPVVIRDAESMLYLRTFYNKQELVSSTVFAMEYSFGKLYCGTAQDDILQFECHGTQLEHRLKAPGSKGITCLRMKFGVLFAGCTNGSVYVYNTKDKPELIKVLEGPGGSVNCLTVLRKQIIISTLTSKLVCIDIPPEVLSALLSHQKQQQKTMTGQRAKL